MNIRINKFLSDSGLCSRRKADEHILRKKITVNGKIAELGDRIDPEKDKVLFEGKEITKSAHMVYYALYKPLGVISTAIDENGRKTVVDLVPKLPRVYPVGRLDRDSAGLIILTNDGELTNILTHPQYEHDKTYEVVIKSRKAHTETELNQLQQTIQTKFIKGLMIEGSLMKADTVKIKTMPKGNLLIKMVIHTGFNRQIRKMCDKVNVDVLSLKRTGIAKLKLTNLGLTPGGYVQIDKSEII